MTKRLLPAIPLLVGLYAPLYLWVRNVDDASAGVALGVIGASVALAAAVLGAALAAFRNVPRATAAATLVLILFFLYGHACGWAWRKGFSTSLKTIYLVVGAVWLAIGGTGILVLARSRRDWTRALGATGMTVGLLCAFAAVQLTFRLARREDAQATRAVEEARAFAARPIGISRPPEREERPDIYYIIADGYARADVLRTHYGYDNAPFLDALRERGFFVADRSCANYPSWTYLSIASSLSMDYLDKSWVVRAEEREDRRPFIALVRGNRVSRFLKGRGYTYATTLTHHFVTEESETADVGFRFRSRILQSEFAQEMIRTSLARLWEPHAAEEHRFALESVRRGPSLRKPLFFFAHFLMPHPPFVFDRHGNVRRDVPITLREKEQGPDGYLGQMEFLNGRLLELVDHLLRSSASPPIIVLQGDHGWVRPGMRLPEGLPGLLARVEQRGPILNALRVPDGVKRRLSPDLTPVNTFRILLGELFGADLPELENRVYVYDPDAPSKIREVSRHLAEVWGTPETRGR
ncbi:MAG TPA: sulfatase-like hydrolase/transferase [Planctomycetota bacterium]|nr:sulfatase-like hydrolase/transferase [Planctomycetota bacterium]